MFAAMAGDVERVGVDVYDDRLHIAVTMSAWVGDKKYGIGIRLDRGTGRMDEMMKMAAETLMEHVIRLPASPKSVSA